MLKRAGVDAPPHTIARLFESQVLGLEDEAALNEIQTIQSGFERWINPGRGWLSPRYSDSRPQVPRSLAFQPVWQRYNRWRDRWAVRVAAPSPSLPWGMTAAGLVIALGTTPMTFQDAATLLGWKVGSVEGLFVRVLRDYPNGAVLVAAAGDSALIEQKPALETQDGEGALPI